MPPISLAVPTGRYLSFEEREEIALLRAKQIGVREIARRIGRDPATISRELRRNAATRSGKQEYRALVAQWKAQQTAKRPKTAKLATNDKLRDYVQERLAGNVHRLDGSIVVGPQPPAWKGLNKPHRQDRRWATAWSPEQIAHRLKVDFPDDESMRISHEAIYQSLFIQGRGALKRELVTCLRTGRALRQPRARTQNHPQGHVTARRRVLPAPRGGSRPRRPRALGGRSDHRHRPVRDRHDRRTQEPLDPVGAPAATARLWRDTAGQERSRAGRRRRRRDERRARSINDKASRAAPNDGSFGTVGDCFDDAAMESFWARMQVELLNTRRWSTTIELAAAMADYIDNFYNVERRHSYLGNISPTEFETLWTSTYSIPQLA